MRMMRIGGSGSRRNVFPRGFTFLEALFVVVIISIVVVIIATPLVNYRQRQALELGAQQIAALLHEARTNTLASKNDGLYGVHFEPTLAALYKTSYSSSTLQRTFTLDPYTKISPVSLAGGGADAWFDRLTGKTSQFGYVEIYLVSSSTQRKRVTIYSTGLIEFQ